MAEPLRVRSYRMYCAAVKLAAGAGLTGERGGSRLAAAKARVAKFNLHERRLKRSYADVLASPEACPQVELMERVLSEAKQLLRAAIRLRRPD
jgi:hypothetical protein